MTCKEMIMQLHEIIWLIFWLSITLHLFLGLFINWMREAIKSWRSKALEK